MRDKEDLLLAVFLTLIVFLAKLLTEFFALLTTTMFK